MRWVFVFKNYLTELNYETLALTPILLHIHVVMCCIAGALGQATRGERVKGSKNKVKKEATKLVRIPLSKLAYVLKVMQNHFTHKPKVTMENRIFTVTENGFSMTSSKVAVPACRIKAISYIEASQKLSDFLSTREPNPDIELITPLENIEFDEKTN